MTADLSRALAEVFNDDEFLGAMEALSDAFPEYRERLPLIPYAYTRTRLAMTPRFEVVAMNWAPGAVSPIHDHGKSRCWVLLLEGSLDVQNYVRESDPEVNPAVIRATEHLTLRAGDLDHRLTPRELHRVANTGPVSTFSLQLYAEPITTYSIIDARTNQQRIVTATCDLEIGID